MLEERLEITNAKLICHKFSLIKFLSKKLSNFWTVSLEFNVLREPFLYLGKNGSIFVGMLVFNSKRFFVRGSKRSKASVVIIYDGSLKSPNRGMKNRNTFLPKLYTP